MVLRNSRILLGSFMGGLLCGALHAEETTDRTAAIAGAEGSIAARGGFPVEQDDKRPAEQRTVQIFNRPLTIGGELDFALDWELDPALDTSAEDDRLTGEELVALEFLYKWSEHTLLFVETEVFYESTWFRDNNRDHVSALGLSRKQHWIFLQQLAGTPFSLQIGRQNIAEKREWWWDTELDGVRLYYELGAVHAEVMLAEEMGAENTVAGFEARGRDVRRVLGRIRWQWAMRHRVEIFLLDQHDHSRQEILGQVIDQSREDENDSDLTWFGLRQSGSFKIPSTGSFYYWADTAIVNGDEIRYDYEDADAATSVVAGVRRQDIRGWAIDTGITWDTNLPNTPTLTLALAVGSGDDSPNDGGSHAFIQTGLNDNNGNFRGVDRFRYYGEFLRPELSNLAVSTVSLGAPFLDNSSIELVYHGYRQLHATHFLRDAKVDATPSGRDADIGDEIDLVIGIEESEHYEFEFVAGVFRAGEAFDQAEGNMAGTVQFKLNYNF